MIIKIVGKRFSNEVKYYDFDTDKKFGYCECIESKEWEIDTENEYSAEKWLIENYPEYSMGANYLWNKGDNGKYNSFNLNAIPCEDCYGKGNFENENNRIAFMRSLI